MSRKVARVTIDSPGRDAGKQFVLTEMSAMRADKWARRALMALLGSGADIPQDVVDQGMAAVASVGFKMLAGLEFEKAEPLMDEMMGCVQICPDPRVPAVTRALIEDDLEEMATIMRLRVEVLQLHVDFSLTAALSDFMARMKAAAGSGITPTSPAPSVQ